jgi:hypothetical protein
VKFTFFIPRGDAAPGQGPPADWLKQLAETDGVRRVDWWTARTVRQPDEVRRSLNDVAGMGEVVAAEQVLWDRVLPLFDQDATGPGATARGMVTPREAEFDLRRDVPHQHYQYLSMPIDWKAGACAVAGEPRADDLYRYVYFFDYKPEIPYDDGEDWYLGHHTREGKQLPGLVRYLTWRRHGADTRGFDRLLGSVRYTELCFDSFEAWYDACYRHGPNWTMPAQYPAGVWTDYHAFFLGPHPDLSFVSTPDHGTPEGST